jgi:hypothetical protein
MPLLARDWNGYVYGTNTGKLNLEFTQQEGELKAILRFMDDATGVVEYQLEGNCTENGHIILNSTAVVGQDATEYGDLHIEGGLSADNTIRGSWRTSIRTGGTFQLHPFVIPNVAGVPQQIVTKRVYLGFVQIDRDDIAKIAQYIKRDFSIGKIIVTFHHEGTEGTLVYDDFISMSNLRRLNYLKLAISEPEGNGFNRVVVMEIRSHGINEIMIQGSQEAWVTGRAVIMEKLMKEFSDIIRDTTFRFSGPLQILLFMGFVIIVSSHISFIEKLQWAAATFLILQVLPWLIQKLFPRAIIVMGEGRTHWLKRLILRAGTWLVGLFCISLSALVTKYGDQIVGKIELLIRTLIGSSSG